MSSPPWFQTAVPGATLRANFCMSQLLLVSAMACEYNFFSFLVLLLASKSAFASDNSPLRAVLYVCTVHDRQDTWT